MVHFPLLPLEEDGVAAGEVAGCFLARGAGGNGILVIVRLSALALRRARNTSDAVRSTVSAMLIP